MVSLYSNPFIARYYRPAALPAITTPAFGTRPIRWIPRFQTTTPADEGGTWVIYRTGQPAYLEYSDDYLNRVAIDSYYDAELNTTVVPYYYSLYGYSAGTSAYDAYDYVTLGDSTLQLFGLGYYEADPVGVTRYGTPQNDLLEGGAGPDVLYGFAGNDSLWGYGGDDSLVGGIDSDILAGGDGNDTLYGEEGGDTLVGDAGNDLLAGGSGVDLMYGGAGDDTLTAGANELTNNYLNAGDGNDNMIGDLADDVMEGGAGNDGAARRTGQQLIVGRCRR